MNNKEKSVADLAARGIAWLTSQALIARVISYFAQLALAWYLSEDDFGLFGMALTISAFSTVLNQGGVFKILIHRHKSFNKWATPGFWLSVTMGVVVSIVMLAMGAAATTLFQVEHPGKLFLLIAILAATPPITAAGTIAKAALHSQLRFKEVAAISTVSLLLRSIAKVVLAAMGFGAFSFVIPGLIFTPLDTIAMWTLSKPPVKKRMMIGRWKYLLGDGVMIILTALWYKLITHGDYLILACMVTQKELGLYFFAFSYSVQSIVMFTQGVAAVSFPALATLNDEPKRQVHAFTRGAKMLAATVFPVCVLQAVLAGPLLLGFFPAKWHPSIPMLQLLSIGMAGRTVSWLAASLMEAQGRFKARMWLGFFSAMLFMLMAYVGALLGGMIGLAVAVAVYYPIMAVCTVLVALPEDCEKMQTISSICLAPAMISAVAIGGAGLLSTLSTGDELTQILFTCVIGSVAYLVLIRIWMRDTWAEILTRLGRLFPHTVRTAANK